MLLLGQLDDPLDVEVALHGRHVGVADEVRLVGLEAVRHHAVDVAVDGDRAEAHLGAGAAHADGDLAAVGDQDLLEGRLGAHLVEGRLEGHGGLVGLVGGRGGADGHGAPPGAHEAAGAGELHGGAAERPTAGADH